MNEKYYLRFIVYSSFVIKLIFILFSHDNSLRGEWLVLFNNLVTHGVFSFHFLDGQYLPSSYMPPLYLIFLYIVNLLSFKIFNFVYLVYFLQVVLSSFSVILFYKFCRFFFEKKISLIGSTLFAFLPILILSNSLISSATIQVFLYLLFFNFSLDFIEKKKKINLLLYSFTCACCFLLRGEFLVIFTLSTVFFLFFFKEKYKQVFILLFVTAIIISPYLIRNYINTDKVHIVNVTGYALWKGNNHLSSVEGFGNPLDPRPDLRKKWPDVKKFSELYKKLDSLTINKNYEIERDKIFFNEAIRNILEDKKKYFMLYIEKIFSFIFFDMNSSNKDYYNLLHIMPIAIISFLSIPGFIIALKQANKIKLLYLTMILSALIFLISIFSILPRYKVSIICFQILFFLFVIDYILKKINSK